MKKEKYIIISLVIAYTLLIFVVWAGILFDALKKQKPLSASNVPVYSLNDLNQAKTVLGKRQNLEYPEKPKIENFTIGLDEPFK
jgi:hypothetical protein